MKYGKKDILQKVLYTIIIFFLISIDFSQVFADELSENMYEDFEIKKYVDTLNEYVRDNNVNNIDLNSIYDDVITGKGVNYTNILDKIADNIIVEVKNGIKSVSVLFIIIIIVAIVSSLEIDKNSDIMKITKIIIIASISSILLKSYIDIVEMFNSVVNTTAISLQTISTFLIGILVATGKITTIGIVEPMIIFVSNAICIVTKYVVIPFFTLSIVINMISRLADNIRLDNFSNIFRKVSLYVFSTSIAIFVLVLSMETSVTKSIDNMYFKATQDVVSNAVPVVGDFLSDSLETVLGATELIGKVGGVVSLVSIILIVGIPVIKLVVIVALYKLLIAISEPINEDDTIIKFISGFKNVYKDMLGILIGVMTLVLMTTGILMNIISKISG